MKNITITKDKVQFQPINISFTIETQEELDSLMMRLYLDSEDVNDVYFGPIAGSGSDYNVDRCKDELDHLYQSIFKFNSEL